jgi:hypothetical protein
MCHHYNGLVQKYEVLKTEDLPDLSGSKFSPRVVRDVAKNVLNFLKRNAAVEGHTYWLFKVRKDETFTFNIISSIWPNNTYFGSR